MVDPPALLSDPFSAATPSMAARHVRSSRRFSYHASILFRTGGQNRMMRKIMLARRAKPIMEATTMPAVEIPFPEVDGVEEDCDWD